uniref:Ras-related protein Rab n=1 Tax=Tetranychus urticae TaxID=32264 RepID=T1K076_TETUR
MLRLWDITGQERFESMNRVYYKGTVGSFILTDAANPDSFKSAVRWKKDFDAKVNMEDGQPAPSILLVNKVSIPPCTDIVFNYIDLSSVQLHFTWLFDKLSTTYINFNQYCIFFSQQCDLEKVIMASYVVQLHRFENIGIDDAAKTLIRKVSV